MRKVLAVILAVTLIMCAFSACGKRPGGGGTGETVDKPVSESEGMSARLVYALNDSFNPFKAESSVNINLMTLLYEGLFTVDETYTVNPAVGLSCECTETGCYVKLNDVKFSDGTPVTGQDVVYSFNLAKECDLYKERLRTIASCAAMGPMMSFVLTEPNVFAAACLTFPIIKEGSDLDKEEEDEDGNIIKTEQMPIGCGRYCLEQTGTEVTLHKNKYKEGFDPHVTTIELTPIKNIDNVNSGLAIGNTCFSFENLSDGTYARINATTVDVPINNFIYLGFNSDDAAFTDPAVRRYISSLIDRKEIASTDFQGHAFPASTPFNPCWSSLPEDGVTVTKAEKPENVSYADGGYTLLVNSDNPFKVDAAKSIAQSFTAAGIKTVVFPLPFDEYITAVSGRKFDFYLGEIRLTADMSLHPLLKGGDCDYGLSEEMQTETALRYAQLRSGGCEIMDFLNVFEEEMPFVPVCYRAAVALYTNSLDYGETTCSDNDIYGNIEDWKFREAKE